MIVQLNTQFTEIQELQDYKVIFSTNADLLAPKIILLADKLLLPTLIEFNIFREVDLNLCVEIKAYRQMVMSLFE